MLIDSIAWTGGLNLASNGNFRRWNLDRFVEVKGVQALTMATIHPSHAKISAAIFLGVIGAQTLQLQCAQQVHHSLRCRAPESREQVAKQQPPPPPHLLCGIFQLLL